MYTINKLTNLNIINKSISGLFQQKKNTCPSKNLSFLRENSNDFSTGASHQQYSV